MRLAGKSPLQTVVTIPIHNASHIHDERRTQYMYSTQTVNNVKQDPENASNKDDNSFRDICEVLDYNLNKPHGWVEAMFKQIFIE